MKIMFGEPFIDQFVVGMIGVVGVMAPFEVAVAWLLGLIRKNEPLDLDG